MLLCDSKGRRGRRPLQRITLFIRRGDLWSPVFMQILPYDKGLLIHRKRSPFPDKGRLVGIVSTLNDLLTIVYKQIKMHRTTKRVTLSLPLSGKGDHEVVDE